MNAAAELETIVHWEPQPGPQSDAMTCPADDLMYGGARGGGKTDFELGEWAVHAGETGRHAAGIVFRRELVQLEEMIQRGHELYTPIGARWHEQKKTFAMPGGARLKFRYLERDEDAMSYQGHSYTRVYFEELTNFPSSSPVDKMYATLRSPYGIDCRMRSSGNPGGPGHQWVKERYITPYPLGYKLLDIDLPKGKRITRCFIPAKLRDNLILMRNDPGYEGRLHLVGSAALVKAWLDGDWDVVEGAFFDAWRQAMVLPPFPIPKHWTRFRSFDWGYARPFSVGWWAISEGELVEWGSGNAIQLPRGSLVRYREWYGCQRKPDGTPVPNTGLRMEAEDIAEGIMQREKGESMAYGVADPSIWDASRGPSIAERMMRYVPDWLRKEEPDRDWGCSWKRGENKRIPGWDQMRQRMRGFDSMPMVYLFGTCTDSVRTIPMLQHDKAKAEDLDTEAEDHAADDWRYGLSSRPMSLVPPPRVMKIVHPLSMDSIAPLRVAQHERYRVDS